MFERVLVLDPSAIYPAAHRELLKCAITPLNAQSLSDKDAPNSYETVLAYIEGPADLEEIEPLRYSSAGLSKMWIAVLRPGEWDWPLLINEWKFSYLLFEDDSLEALTEALEKSARSYQTKDTYRKALREFKTQNRQLEKGQEDLNLKVKERTDSLFQSKRELEAQVAQTRDLMRFIQELSAAMSIEDLFGLLRREIKSFHSVGSPLLYYHLNPSNGYLLWSQSQVVISKPIRREDPPHLRIRVNQVEDSKALANLLSRPFNKVIAFPFSFRQSRALAEIFFEHQLEGESLDVFLKFVSERLQAFAVALDRILLDIDLGRASSQWENTFDGLDQPIAIVDMDLQVLRHNRHFFGSLLPEAEDTEGVRLWKSSLMEAPHKKLQWKTEKATYQVDLYPIKVEESEVADHVICYYTDITLQRELQGQVIQNEKMAALGHLAGNIAHELNNPLTGIRSLSQVLVRQVGEDSQVGKDLLEVEKAAERSQKIITNLLDFARSDEHLDHRQVINLNDVVEKALSLLKTLMSTHYREIELYAYPLIVAGEPHLLQQVIFNLVHNACQAMSDPGELEILTGIEGDFAFFSVKDSGVGIPEEIQAQIFEPFFTTKEEGQGTGLGLSISQKLVQNMNGRIELKSQVGLGTQFKVLLPLYEESQP